VKKAEPWAGSGIVLSGLGVVGGAKIEQSLHRVYRARASEVSLRRRRLRSHLCSAQFSNLQLARRGVRVWVDGTVVAMKSTLTRQPAGHAFGTHAVWAT
jgi:hypothetical protein